VRTRPELPGLELRFQWLSGPYYGVLFKAQVNHLGLPADVFVGMLKKEISFALRRGTSAQVTTAHDAAQRVVEVPLVLKEAAIYDNALAL
jgi:hypothetical protein